MSLAGGDLTTLPTATAYLATAPSAAVLQGMITRISRQVLSILNRPILVPHTYNEMYNGWSTDELILFNWPLIVLNSLQVLGLTIPLAPVPVYNQMTFSQPFGYRFVPWSGIPPGNPPVLEMVGSRYWRGSQTTVVNYRAGYIVQNEAWTVPATPYQVTPLAPYGIWATDEGVTYAATGVALIPVAFPATPTIGHYVAPDPTVSRFYYSFAAADTTRGRFRRP